MDNAIEVVTLYSFWDVVKLLAAIVVLVGVVLFAIKKVYDALELYRKKRNGFEDKDEQLEERIEALEKNDVKVNEKLDTISASMQQMCASMDVFSESVNRRLDKMQEENRQTAVAQARSTLYRLASDFSQKDHITTAEYSTFRSLADIYLDNGGNSVFKHKIIPEIEAMQVRD